MRSLVKSLTLGQTDTLNPRLESCALQSPGRDRGALGSHDIQTPNRYAILAVLTAAVHIAVITYTAFGGFLALRWRRSLWLHLLAGLWGMSYVTTYPPCPLTDLERWARAKAGMPPLPPDGFVGRYINVVYPARWMGAVRPLAFVTALVPWTLYAWRGQRHNSSAQRADRAEPGGSRR
jgi:hypothetical protein